MPFQLVRKLFEEMIKTFLKLEQKNIAHRDLKPDNILIKYNENGEIEKFSLCDFSEGKIFEEMI